MEVEEEAVPWVEQPALVNLQRVRVDLSVEVEVVIAVEAVKLPLVCEGAAVRVRQRHHELHCAPVLGDVRVVDEVRGWADPHGQMHLELEFRGVLEGGRDRCAAMFEGEALVQARSWKWQCFHNVDYGGAHYQ